MDLFASLGANVIACAYQPTEEFLLHVEDLKQQHQVQIFPVIFDMMDNGSIKNAAISIQKLKLPIDVLINIAGTISDAIFPMVTVEEMQKIFQVNFISQIVLSQYMTKLMLRQGHGSIIFTSSITALDGNNGQLAYGASKAALLSAMKTMAIELGDKGIRVNAVAPGVIKTQMTEKLMDGLLQVKMKNSSLKRCGLPEEVANLFVFLASDDSAYITGQTIRIDGGIG